MRSIFFFLYFASSIYATTIGDFFAMDPKLKGAQVGIYIEDAKTNEEAFSFNGETNYQLGSLVKVATAFAAVKKLGNAFRFETKIEYTGALNKNGVLQGNILVTGGGDPTLPLDVIPEWGFAIKKKGIHSIEGRVIVDASCFETLGTSPHWEYMDLGNHYAAGASGLSINHNRYNVVFRPGKKVGDKADVVQMVPSVPSLTVSNEVKTGAVGSGDKACIYGSEYSPLQIFRGTVPAGTEQFTVKGSLPDPARFCAETLSKHLQLRHPPKVIRSKGKREETSTLIAIKQSPPLNQIVREMLWRSDNLYAEHLLKTIGDGQSEVGLAREGELLEQEGIALYLKDGCGGARTNYGSPKEIVHLIRVLRADTALQQIVDALPELGEGGTLAKMTPIHGARVFGKTGSMNGIFNLAGLIMLQDGRSYNFCICINNFVCSPKVAKKSANDFLRRFIEEIL